MGGLQRFLFRGWLTKGLFFFFFSLGEAVVQAIEAVGSSSVSTYSRFSKQFES